MKRILLASLILALSTASNAGILIEPYIGYSINSGENGQSPKMEYEMNAPFIGGRLGYQSMGFMFGVDFNKGLESSLTLKVNGTEGDTDAEQQTIGAFVGYNLPALLRIWGGYYFSSKLEFTESNSEYKGSGFGVGVGYTGLPFVSLNLEYRTHTFDEAEFSDGSTASLSGASEVDFNQIMLSVSAPFDF